MLGRLLAPFFARVTVDPEATARLAAAHERGHVVHVFRAHRVIDPLFLLFALDRLGLPGPPWMHDHYASTLEPSVAKLTGSLAEGAPALLFLRRPVTLTNPSAAYPERHVEALIELQRRSTRPILLLPETLQWTKRAAGLRRTIVDSIFGDREAPGRLRELLGFFWQYETARFHVGAPVDLAAVLEREKGKPLAVIAKKIRWSILHHLSREDALRAGPPPRSAARTRQMVLNDPAVRRFLSSRAGGEPGGALERKAEHMLRAIAADVRYGWLRVLDVIIDKIWDRIYDGISVDAAGLARVRSAARRGPVVLVPSHKSHIDYLVLGQVFFKDGMMPPLVAAGENLSFPPVGTIFRRAGAFFLRRSFKGDKLYATVFAAYVRRVLKEGHALEFFIEGGRSRTGRLLSPKMGMLTMCVEPVLDGAINDVSFIPVSISYEKIIEARSYQHELSGGSKKKEDVGALLSSTSVLRSRYGRVYVDFDEPISLRVFAAARGYELKSRPELQDSGSDEPSPAARALVNQLGRRITFGINQVTRVTPTSVAALALLAVARRGMAENELQARVERLLGLIEELGARRSAALDPATRRAAIREALGRFAVDGLVEMHPTADGETIYRVGEDGRRALDYYKNNILHFFVPSAIVLFALLRCGGSAVPDGDLRARVVELSRVLAQEVSFRAERDLDGGFDDAAEHLTRRRTIERREVPAGEGTAGQGGRVSWSITENGREEARELSGLLAVYLETYRVTAECVRELGEGALAEKKLAQRVLQLARKQVLEDKMRRPEGATLPAIEAAIARLLADDVLVRRDGAIALASEEKRSAFVAELGPYLDALG